MAETLETKIKKDIAAYLDSLGTRCWHIPYHNMGYGVAGVPDRLVCYRGRFLAIEVKRDAEHKPTTWQARRIKEIREADGRAAVVWTVEQVKEIIGQIDLDVMLSANVAVENHGRTVSD